MNTRTRKPASPDQPSLIGTAPPSTAAAAPEPTPPTPMTDVPEATAIAQATTPPVAVPTAAPTAVPAPAERGLIPVESAKVMPIRSAELSVTDGDPFDLSPEELAEVLGADGLNDISGEDFRIGYWVYNVLNKEIETEKGTKIRTRRDQFWNTLTNRVCDRIEGVFVGFRKTHTFDRYNNKTNKTDRFCRSDDRTTGTALADFSYKALDAKGAERTVQVKQGDRRPCASCPQQEWRSIVDPETNEARQKKDCALLRNFVFFETGAGSPEPGVIRFKRSSANAARDMLSRYFYGKWRLMVPKIDPRTKRPVLGADGKPLTVPTYRSYPLYAFVFEISLAVDKSGNYAVPEFKKIREATHDEIMYWKGQAEFIANMSARVIEEADKQEAAAGVGAEDETRGGAPAGDSGSDAAEDGFDDSKVTAPTGSGAPADDNF